MEPRENITLRPMTPALYHAFFREYENDRDLYLDPTEFREYTYDKAWVDAYIQRQFDRKRLTFGIFSGDILVGELKLYDIVDGQSAVLGISMKNANYKDKGYGTQAERLAIHYVFWQLDIPVLYADCVLTNTRSRHVLEKVGFEWMSSDAQRAHYRITRNSRNTGL